MPRVDTASSSSTEKLRTWADVRLSNRIPESTTFVLVHTAVLVPNACEKVSTQYYLSHYFPLDNTFVGAKRLRKRTNTVSFDSLYSLGQQRSCFSTVTENKRDRLHAFDFCGYIFVPWSLIFFRADLFL